MPTRIHASDRLRRANRALRGAQPVPLRLVRGLLAAGRPGLAALVARALVWLGRGDDTLRHVLAVLLWARDDTAGAIRMAGRAVVQNPTAPQHRWLLAAIHETSGRPDRALAVLGEERPMAEALPALRLRIALHLRRGDAAASARLARIAHDRFPGRPDPLRLLIAARMRSGDFDAAARLAELACARFPLRADFWLLRATIADRMGDLDAAEAMLHRCLECRPGWLAVTRRLVRLRQMKGDLEGARRLAFAAVGTIQDLDLESCQTAIETLGHVGCDPPVDLLRAVAGEGRAEPEAAMDRLGACLALGDWAATARALGDVLASGAQDARLIAMLTGAGAELDIEASRLGLPAPALVVDKLKRHARAEAGADAAMADADFLIARILQGQTGEDPAGPFVSYVCPVHRAGDVPNLLAQIHRQDWRGAEVIFCINADDIAEQDLALDPAKGFQARHLRLPPGRSIGHYLNRSIAAARGEIVLRLDADDRYDAEYTRCMVGFLRATGADIVSMYPYCFFFEALGQSYLISSLDNPLTRDLGRTDRQAMGSGSSLCARRAVFATLAFDESLTLGEDLVFYRRAVAQGLRVCTLPGYFHTAKRGADKEVHTWRLGDARMLSRRSRYLGEGCVILRPGDAGAPTAGGDLVEGVLDDPAFADLRELRLEAALSAVPQPVRLITDPRSPVACPQDVAVGVSRDGTPGVASAALTIAFCPEDPAREETLAARHEALAFRQDIAPHLICGDRDAFARLGGLRRSDRAGFLTRFDRAGLRYAILTNPRSGSEHLCALLASIGLGAPAEHIRAPAAGLIARDPDPDAFLRRVLGQVECDGIVGTKLVSQYLLSGTPEPVAERVIAWMAAAGFRFVRLVRPECETAVSAWIADQRGVWHRRRGQIAGAEISALPDAEQGLAPQYDFEAIAREMERHRAWSRELDRLTQSLIPEDRVYRLAYKTLSRTPGDAVRRIARFLDFTPLRGTVPVSPLTPVSGAVPARDDHRARFAADLAAGGLPRAAAARTSASGGAPRVAE